MFKVVVTSRNQTQIEAIVCHSLFEAGKIMNRLRRMQLNAYVLNVL